MKETKKKYMKNKEKKYKRKTKKEKNKNASRFFLASFKS
jgi:hypothetical protein